MSQSTTPVVGVGASAGGIQALKRLFEALPNDTGAAYVVVIHLDPQRSSDLAAVLAGSTRMPVVQVSDDAQLENDRVYVIAPNRGLAITDGMIVALPPDEDHPNRAPISAFFRSIAEHRADGIGVILTGAGSDGGIGAKAIREAGGIVIAQDPAEAEFASMPRSAIAMDAADFVLPIREIAEKIAELLRHRQQIEAHRNKETDEEILRRILAHIRVRTGHDFSSYKRATIIRRIARRSQVTHQDSLSNYYAYLRENSDEAQALFADFLISVTTFFRDAKAFDALAKEVIPLLFDDKGPGSSIRVWVPGCATGEEAYSIGMLLLEEASRRDVRPEIQVFGSDLDAGALAIAREGRFPATIEADVSEERLRRFFQREGDHYRVRRELREVVLFANHSVLRDPPFSRLNLISCRNLLIYLDRELQQQVCNTFHYALYTGGFLFIGASESADQPAGLFRPVDRDAKIYRSAAASGARAPALPILLGPRRDLPEAELSTARASVRSENSGDSTMHRQMLERVAPPSMLVDSAHRAVHLSENAGRFLQLSGGPVSMDATEMVRSELRFDLRTALHRAFERGEATLSMPLFVRFNGSAKRVYLQVKPYVEQGDPARYALVLFIEGEEVGSDRLESDNQLPTGEPTDAVIKQLQEELQLTQSRLRATREESEAATEEFRAANEELQSINEEYRSTSEELETSKEELQSINEELQTVNNELKLKLETVSRAHSDLQNLMAATDVGTLFLDTALRIKRFTPRLSEIFNVTTSDEGRPITDFTHQLEYDSLPKDALGVLKDLTPFEHEVKSRGNGWFLLRIRPYRTIDDKIDGVVITFVDITERRRVEEALRDSESRLKQEMRQVELSRTPMFVWDFDGGVVRWNRGSELLYGYARQEAIGKRVDDLLQPAVVGGSLEQMRQALVETGEWFGEMQQRTKNGHWLTVECQVELQRIDGRRLVLESARDVTEQKKWEQRRQLLLDELSHRVSNTLSVVQSMARQTHRTAKSNEEFVQLFDGRLTALALAHELLRTGNWEGAELGALARSQLAAYLGNDGRLSIEGDAVKMPPEIATPFALLLHELATNAAKYGALSGAAGHVRLSWSTLGRHLTLTWQERGGPPVRKPARQGFGGQLIERGLPGGAVRRTFAEDGVVCTIDIDLPEHANHAGAA
ncbi:MAG TPA: chemotaxis protein CheB [Rudaea sp.]|nr:chemotaxis protein CheB [Rudaea sp.]